MIRFLILIQISLISFIALVEKSWSETLFVRPPDGAYGLEDGTSYSNAFKGWSNISWGEGLGSVSAGDTLYVCGNHLYSSEIRIGIDGSKSEFVTIAGDAKKEPGTITFMRSGFLHINRSQIKIKGIKIGHISANKNITFCIGNNLIFEMVEFNHGNHGLVFSSGEGVIINNVMVDKCKFQNLSGYGFRWLVTNSNATSLINPKIINSNFIGGKGIEIRSENDAPNGVCSNPTIIGNTFKSLSGRAINLIGTGAENTYPWGGGALVQNNKIDGATVGIVFGSFNAPDWGKNIISGNIIRNTTKANGPIDVFCSRYISINDNIISHSLTDTIDGNGVLVDYGNSYVRVFNNKIENMLGNPNAENSGCGIMVLDSDNVTCWSNICNGNRIGIWVSREKTAYQFSDIAFYNNTIINNTRAGVWIHRKTPSRKVKNIIFYNNIFTGKESSVEGLNNESSGGKDSIWDNNVLYGFRKPYHGHSPGLNDLIVDPKIDSNFFPLNLALKGSGKVISNVVYYNGDKPSFGSFDIGALPCRQSPPKHIRKINDQ